MVKWRHQARQPPAASGTVADMDTDVTDNEPEPTQPPQPVDKAARLRSFRVRTISTVTLIAVYLGIIWAGHVPLMLLMLALQVAVAKELFALAAQAQASMGRKRPSTRLQWYFFWIAVFWLYFRFINNNLLVELTSDKRLARLFYWALKHHNLISYSLYMAGFVMFVLSLRKSQYIHQFGQYAWIHMILLVTTVPSSFFVANIFSGIIWYVLPASLIIANDIFAYLAGFFFGRTPLIKLSPKKTWEGFIGGFLGTLAMAFWFAGLLARYDWMTCPRKDLTVFGSLHCPREAIFVPVTHTLADLTSALPESVQEYVGLMGRGLPDEVQQYISAFTITAAPIQWHALAIATFASIIGPFGGFFASGFKRAFKMKDFGDTIPGHGGVTDRFDCQILMAVFSYCYYWSYVSEPEVTIGGVLALASKLSDHDQVLLFGKLANLLAGEGIIPGDIVDYLSDHLGRHFAADPPQ